MMVPSIQAPQYISRSSREGGDANPSQGQRKLRHSVIPSPAHPKYAVKQVDADPDLAGLLITGTGDVFALGEDNWLTFGSALGMDALPFDTLRQSAKPVVAAVNGLCQGRGLQIALCADMAVISERATFRVPELRRPRRSTGGWWPGWSRTTNCPVLRAKCLCNAAVPRESGCSPAWVRPNRSNASWHSRNVAHRAGCTRTCGWTGGCEARRSRLP